MKTLTKEQKLTIYEAMLDKITKIKCMGFCESAASACIELGFPYNEFQNVHIKDYLPELMAYKPTKLINGYWFNCDKPGNITRIEILGTIIYKLKEKPTMTKKILKEVSLLNDYRTIDILIPAGTPLEYNLRLNPDYPWKLISKFGKYVNSYSEADIINCETNLFKFIKEPEGFVFDSGLTKHEFNRLADWCDELSRDVKKDDNYYYSVTLKNNCIETYTSLDFHHIGIRFNSPKSAKLFIKELDKPENLAYKNYFIELFKRTRL